MTAFVNVNVIQMDTERVLANHTVLVENGRITALGPNKEVRVPTNAVQIDGRGKYLIPGLVDMHGHVYGWRSLSHGVTAYRTVESSRSLSARAERSTAYRYTAGDLRDFVQPGRSLHEIAAAYKAAGHEFVSTELYGFYEKMAERENLPTGELPGRSANVKSNRLAARLAERELLDSLLAIARLAGLPVGTHGGGHLYYPEDLMLRFSFFGGGSIEHLYGFIEGSAYYHHTGDDKTLDTVPNLHAVATAVQRAGIWITPTLGCMEKGPRISRVSRNVVKVLQETGVGLLLGADDSSDVHRELGALVNAGLTPYQALLTGTRNPAQYFGILDQVGSVAVGKRADLVLLKGNPLQDIYQTVDPAGVMLRGQWFPSERLEAQQLKSNVAYTYWPRVIQEVVRRARWIFGDIDRNLVHRFQYDESVESARKTLADSLTSGGRALAGHRRVFQLVATQLGEYRARLTAAQQTLFDKEARLWLGRRKQEGYLITIPDVQP